MGAMAHGHGRVLFARYVTVLSTVQGAKPETSICWQGVSDWFKETLSNKASGSRVV